MAGTNVTEKPSISIVFKTLSDTFAERTNTSEVIVIIKDDTNTVNKKEYSSKSDLIADKANYTADNFAQLEDCFVSNITKLTVLRAATMVENIDAELSIATSCNEGYIGVLSKQQADQDALVAWVKEQEANNRNYTGIVFNSTTTPDSRHVLYFNQGMTFSTSDTRGHVAGDKYISSLLGYIAGRNRSVQSPTYLVLDNLDSVDEVADEQVALNNGQLVLFNDAGKARILSGINSKTTFADMESTEEKYIEFSETMDTIYRDIYSTYKDYYLSKYKNFNNNREILIAAINTYFNALESEEILDPDNNNYVEQNVTKMRQFLKSKNVLGVDDMTDAQVKNKNFGKKVFLQGHIRIAESMQDLDMENILE